ncbi:MAG: hypothetical protein P0116_16650 [Candidatus Nitrosocosmicus sp.]|nr:hypothetical protein [Candidatus Nitrosocosmicus sp.]
MPVTISKEEKNITEDEKKERCKVILHLFLHLTRRNRRTFDLKSWERQNFYPEFIYLRYPRYSISKLLGIPLFIPLCLLHGEELVAMMTKNTLHRCEKTPVINTALKIWNDEKGENALITDDLSVKNILNIIENFLNKEKVFFQFIYKVKPVIELTNSEKLIPIDEDQKFGPFQESKLFFEYGPVEDRTYSSKVVEVSTHDVHVQIL